MHRQGARLQGVPLPGRTRVSCVDYEDPAHVGEHWPNELAPVITAAALDVDAPDFEERLTQVISDHLGLPALDRGSLTVDRGMIAASF
ncbi:hypothetical protein [Streptomyces tritici]|uniref:hypothetical protein n=1 Tax=Streptomyces tritici TaxID=2054410 RepID=UPI003AF1AB50